MKLNLKLLTVASFGLLFTTCANDAKNLNEAKPLQKENLSGYYHGILPCASCSGIDTWLNFNEAGFYEINEDYVGSKDSVFKSEGKFELKNSQIIINDKNEKRKYALLDGKVAQIGDNAKVINEYVLDKVYDFAGDGKQLLIEPSSVNKTARYIKFTGTINNQFKDEKGNLSSKANYAVSCDKDFYDIGDKKLFKSRFAFGKSTPTKDTSVKFQGDDDVIKQARDVFCK